MAIARYRSPLLRQVLGFLYGLFFYDLFFYDWFFDRSIRLMAVRWQIYLPIFLFLMAAIATSQYFNVAMMGLSAFVLAYATKGMRR